MLNIEKYKNEIRRIINYGDGFAFSNGKIESCVNTKCENCRFSGMNSCKTQKFDWLLEEHKEPREIDWDKDIDWERVPVNTPVIVWNYGNKYGVQSAMFVAKRKLSGYFAFLPNKNKNDDFKILSWDHCKLANFDDVERYRRKK